jgi:hypothetical protein
MLLKNVELRKKIKSTNMILLFGRIHDFPDEKDGALRPVPDGEDKGLVDDDLLRLLKQSRKWRNFNS